MDNTRKFSGKAAVYDRCRPCFPEELADFLCEKARLSRGEAMADVGSGTGLSALPFLERGMTVYGVEPNADMRRAAVEKLGKYPDFHPVAGTAEATLLAAASVKLVIAVQAFHWFDPEKFRDECRRILTADGLVALVWISREETSGIVQANGEICRRCCPDFRGFSGGRAEKRETVFRRFFRDGVWEEYRRPLDLSYTQEAFVGRNFSASYAPSPDSPAGEAFRRELNDCFRRFAVGGELRIPHNVCCFRGRV